MSPQARIWIFIDFSFAKKSEILSNINVELFPAYFLILNFWMKDFCLGLYTVQSQELLELILKNAGRNDTSIGSYKLQHWYGEPDFRSKPEHSHSGYYYAAENMEWVECGARKSYDARAGNILLCMPMIAENFVILASSSCLGELLEIRGSERDVGCECVKI